MTSTKLDSLIAAAKEGRCQRVVTCRKGGATSPSRAQRTHGIAPDVVFIRSDGWTLGAPRRFTQVAWELWKGFWVASVDVRTQAVEIFEGPVKPWE